MADLQSMTVTERMNTINGDNKDAYTFKEALNRYLILDAHSDYSTEYTELNKYEPEEALNIILKQTDIHKYSVRESLNILAGSSSDLTKYSSQEALNYIETLAAFDDYIS